MKIAKILRLKRPLYKYSRYNMVAKIAPSCIREALGAETWRLVPVYEAHRACEGASERVPGESYCKPAPPSPVRLCRGPRPGCAWPSAGAPPSPSPAPVSTRAGEPSSVGTDRRRFRAHREPHASSCLGTSGSVSNTCYLNRLCTGQQMHLKGKHSC